MTRGTTGRTGPAEAGTARFDLTLRGRQKRIFGGTIVVLLVLAGFSIYGTVADGRSIGGPSSAVFCS